MLFRFGERKKIAERLYGQNLELAVKNKTLSLLEKLYLTSVVNLTPKEMGQQITDRIREDLNLELSGVLIFDTKENALNPLAFSKSKRLDKTLITQGVSLEQAKITDVAHHAFLQHIIESRTLNLTNDVSDVWQKAIDAKHLDKIKQEAHIKTVLLFPIIRGPEVFGLLMLGFNRDYNALNPFEKTAMNSFTNTVSLLLDKAYLNKALADSLEVTKKAYALEKKSKEELELLDKVKNQFLAQTQHDLRTPLTLIRNFCDLLLKDMYGKQTKKAKEVITRIEVISESKIKEVNTFLDVTQFQLGKKVVTLAANVPLNPILQEAVTELQSQAEAKGIYLKLELPEVSPMLIADREKLKSALVNVIDNSIKYTNKGGVTISSRISTMAKIVIADTGVGMDSAVLDKLFKETVDTKAIHDKDYKGKGMGMYLSAKIIGAHNGKIFAESAGLGKGSSFNIDLPITPQETKPEPSKIPAEAKTPLPIAIQPK